MKSFIKKIISLTGYTISPNSSIQSLHEELGAYIELLSNSLPETPPAPEEPSTIEGVVFSMDRAAQLHSMLCSYFEKVVHPPRLHILYRSSSPDHEKAYLDVFEIFQGKLGFCKKEEHFQQNLITLVDDIASKSIFFLVDDIIFTREVSLNDFSRFSSNIFIPSLRLGKNISHYKSGKKSQKLPEFIEHHVINKEKYLIWKWSDGYGDWNFPLSLDGNIYGTDEIKQLLPLFVYRSPNILECKLQRVSTLFSKRFGICKERSSIVNIPANKVQDDFDNVSGSIHPDYILSKWQEGMRINHNAFSELNNNCPHMLLPLEFVKRDNE